MKNARYGVIGTGFMGIEHIMNLKHVNGADIVAVADTNAGSLAAGAELVGGDVEQFATHQELIAADICDAVVVVTPNMTHAAVLEDLLAVDDLHILVEKPLCTTIEDCQTIIEAAEGRSGLVWVGLEYRYMTPFERLIEEVQAGTVGDLKMLSIREHRFPFLPKVDDWNRFNRNSGGTLVEKCCHFFDLMNLVANSTPVQVYASGGQDVNHLNEVYDGETSDIMDNAFVVVDYENGVRAMLDLCMFAEATKNQEEMIAIGSKGKVQALVPEDVVRIGRRGQHFIGDVEEHHVETDAPYLGHHQGSSYREHVDFLKAIQTGTRPDVTLQEGLMSVAVGVAGQRSIEQGRPVQLSEVL